MKKSLDLAITPLSEADVSTVTHLLNLSSRHDAFNEDLVRDKTFGDPDFDADLCHIAFYGDMPVAFICAVLRQNIRGEDIGYIKLLAVAPAYRRRGMGDLLVARVEEVLKKRSAHKVRVYDAPFNYYMPGIDPRYTEAVAFFERHGYRRFNDTCNMDVDLSAADWSTKTAEKKLSQNSIEILRCSETYQDELMHFVDSHFDLWRPEVEKMLARHPRSVHIALEEGELFAFSGHSANNVGMPWFGPMGTHPQKRGRGVGGILLKRCLKDLKEMGFETAIIPWVGPVAFYQYHAAATVTRVFWRYEKIL